MLKLHTCHLPNITVLFCIGVERLGLAEALQRRRAHIVVCDITELEGRR